MVLHITNENSWISLKTLTAQLTGIRDTNTSELRSNPVKGLTVLPSTGHKQVLTSCPIQIWLLSRFLILQCTKLVLCLRLLNVTPQLRKDRVVVSVMCSQWPHSGEETHPSVVLARAPRPSQSEHRRTESSVIPPPMHMLCQGEASS